MTSCSSATPDPDLVDNVASSKNLVLNEADLKITKFGKMDGEVRAGEILTYTVIVDNLGPSWATGAAIKDVLASSGTFDVLGVLSNRDMECESQPVSDDTVDPFTVAATVNPPWPDPMDENAPLPGRNEEVVQRYELDCVLDDPLEVLDADGFPNPGRWIVTMMVTAPQTQDINNVATVLSEADDPNQDNNMAMVEHDITDVADLEVTKVAVGEVHVATDDDFTQMGTVFDPGNPGVFRSTRTTRRPTRT